MPYSKRVKSLASQGAGTHRQPEAPPWAFLWWYLSAGALYLVVGSWSTALAWGVTDVMAASPGGSNTSVWGQPATSAVGYFTEAFGPPTSVGPGWWVWHLTPRSVGAIVTPSVSLSCNTLAGDDPSKVIPCLTLAR